MVTPPFFDAKRLLLVNFWYCPGVNKTPLHCDWAANLVCQVRGSKRFLLFPPGAPVYPHPNKANFSRVDIEAPDMQRFPRFDPSLCHEVDLRPGEMLHVPGLWYHQVHSDANLAVNWWWWPTGATLARTFLTRQFLAYALRHGRDKLGQKLLGRKDHAGVEGGY
jgi:lysine-specific demethylase 8